MLVAAPLPHLTHESGPTRYLEEIWRFPMLEPQEEYMLAKSWRDARAAVPGTPEQALALAPM